MRLPIQGLDKKWDHPISFGKWDGAMVGEFFNFKELEPLASSDLPVALKYWDALGTKSFDLFDGFWALVFIDRSAGTTYVVTDPLAKKPLYYRKRPRMMMSSEIWPLTIDAVTIDPVYRSAVMKWGYCPEDRTPFAEIQKIPPGMCMEIGIDGTIERAFRYESRLLKPTFDDEYGNPLYNLMKDAVKNRLVSDVPVSLLLSGGLDSSILYKITERLTHNFTVFHVANSEEEYLNDLDIPGDIRVVKVKVESVSFEDAIETNQTPVDLGSVIPQFALGKIISKAGFRVALSGDGADELFGGYRRAMDYDSQMSDVFHELVYYHLPRLDSLMMASTVELRCPYLSWPVIRKAMTIPWEQRRSKEFLKAAFADAIPKKILNRPKKPLRVSEYDDDRIGWRKKCVETFDRILERRKVI
jgi:asparagine synthase (glutamine-hydrolysing)